MTPPATNVPSPANAASSWRAAAEETAWRSEPEVLAGWSVRRGVAPVTPPIEPAGAVDTGDGSDDRTGAGCPGDGVRPDAATVVAAPAAVVATGAATVVGALAAVVATGAGALLGVEVACVAGAAAGPRDATSAGA
jgi:hypothetical protein